MDLITLKVPRKVPRTPSTSALVGGLAGLVLALASLTPLQANSTNLRPVGQSTFHWLMLPIYQASLKTADGQYHPERYPQALEIQYLRPLSRTVLLQATDQQWQHLGIADPARERWLEQLSTLWPEIKRGDRLLFQVDPQLNNQFYHNGRPIGGIADPEFSRQFLAIWLSPRTSQPKLRAQLIAPQP